MARHDMAVNPRVANQTVAADPLEVGRRLIALAGGAPEGCMIAAPHARLTPSDSAMLAGLFERLSPDSLYRRFFTPAVKLHQFQSAILSSDRYEREAIAALEHGEIIGVAQYSREPGSRRADMAIVVADAWQRHGVGTRLVAALADVAAANGIDAFGFSIQLDNDRALKLLGRLSPGLRLMPVGGGVGEGSISLDQLR